MLCDSVVDRVYRLICWNLSPPMPVSASLCIVVLPCQPRCVVVLLCHHRCLCQPRSVSLCRRVSLALYRCVAVSASLCVVVLLCHHRCLRQPRSVSRCSGGRERDVHHHGPVPAGDQPRRVRTRRVPVPAQVPRAHLLGRQRVLPAQQRVR